MKTLLKYYDENRKNTLKTQLSQNNSLNRIFDTIQNEINSLRDINGEYIQELTPSQARIALKGLAEINQSLSLMTAIIPPELPLVSDVQDSVKSLSEKNSPAIISIAALSGGAGGIFGSFVGYLLIKKQALNISPQLIDNISQIAEKYPNVKDSIKKYPDFHDNIVYLSENKNQVEQLSDINQINPVIPVGIGFVIGIFIAATIALVLYHKHKKQPHTQPKTNVAPPQVNQVKFTEDILDFLHNKFENIDKEVAKESNQVKPKPPTPKLEDHPDILNFLQNFMGEVSDEQANLTLLTNKLSQQIPDILHQNGINVEFYQPGREDTSKFDFVKNIDPKVREYVTLTPAFIKDNQVIRRGRVVKPASF